jgi:hypothetical protein
VPLSELQTAILLLLAEPGRPALLRRHEIFHDREEVVAAAASADAALLATAGFDIERLRREPGIDAAPRRDNR